MAVYSSLSSGSTQPATDRSDGTFFCDCEDDDEYTKFGSRMVELIEFGFPATTAAATSEESSPIRAAGWASASASAGADFLPLAPLVRPPALLLP